jgi:hypothetical protein
MHKYAPRFAACFFYFRKASLRLFLLFPSLRRHLLPDPSVRPGDRDTRSTPPRLWVLVVLILYWSAEAPLAFVAPVHSRPAFLFVPRDFQADATVLYHRTVLGY